jgi:hypothetical protein
MRSTAYLAAAVTFYSIAAFAQSVRLYLTLLLLSVDD